MARLCLKLEKSSACLSWIRWSRKEWGIDMDRIRATWALKNITWWTRWLAEQTSYSSASSAISRHPNSVIWSTIKKRTARKRATSVRTAATPSFRLATATGTTWVACAWRAALEKPRESSALSSLKTKDRQKPKLTVTAPSILQSETLLTNMLQIPLTKASCYAMQKTETRPTNQIYIDSILNRQSCPILFISR